MSWTKVLTLLTFLWSLNTQAIVRVGVLDTGLDLKDPRFKDVLCIDGHQDFSGRGLYDYDGHGTHVSGLIKQYAGDHGYCLVIIKYYDETASSEKNYFAMINALMIIKNLNLDFVNISGGGEYFWEHERNLMASNPNTLFITAAGNNGKLMTYGKYCYYPCCYELVNNVCVGAISRYGRTKFSNYGRPVTAWENGLYVKSTLPNGKYGRMVGSSMSTAIHTGKLVKEKINASYR